MPELETSLYSVSLLNDDETPMEFVVHVLEVFFDMDWDTAKQKMLLIHHHGTAECGCYSYELARHIFPPPRVGKAPPLVGYRTPRVGDRGLILFLILI